MAKIGLVLEGGGMRGLYTAGVTFGVNLPSGQKGRVLRYNTANAGNPEYISVRSLLKTGDIINKHFAYDVLPNVLDPFDNVAFKASGVEFYATVTNVNTGEAEYMLVDDCNEKMDVIRASASLPFVSRKVYLDGVPYLDGGIVDNIPLDKCMSLGCDRIIVVLTHPRDFVRRSSMETLGKIFYPRDRKLIEAFAKRNERYNRTMAKIRRMEEEGGLIVIAPDTELDISRLESDPEKMKAAHASGFADANESWALLQSYIETSFSDH